MSLAFTENVEFFRPNRQRHSFGTRGSQVQILPLRPTESITSEYLGLPALLARPEMRDETPTLPRGTKKRPRLVPASAPMIGEPLSKL